MPLAKHRPDFAELITIAALQRKSIQKRQNKHYASLRKKEQMEQLMKKSSDEEEEGALLVEAGGSGRHTDRGAQKALAKITRNDFLIDMSGKIRKFLDIFAVRLARISIVVLAFLNLTYEAQTTRGRYPRMDNGMQISDNIVAIYFVLEGSLKALAFYAQMDMHKAFDLKIDSVLYIRKLGFIDIILGILTLYFGANSVGGWLRLLRVLLISSFALDETPHLVILVSGITHGLKSILSTCLLLALVFMVYAAFALFFFGRNDPYHFGTIALGMWSFFELSTLDNWSQVLYVNMYGCDRFPAYYTVVNSTYAGALSISRYGSTMILPICQHPEEKPVLSAIIFLSFIVICAFILVNLTVAAVTSGINVRLDSIKNEGSSVTNALSQMVSPDDVSSAKLHTDATQFRLADPAMLLIMLKQVWREQDQYARKKKAEEAAAKNSPTAEKAKKTRKALDTSSLDLHKKSGVAKSVTMSSMSTSSTSSTTRKSSLLETSSFDEFDHEGARHTDDDISILELRGQSMLYRDLLAHYVYQYVIFVLIAVSAFAELVALQSGSFDHIIILVLNLFLQVLFTVDIYIQIVAVYPNFHFFFKNNWQCFDAAIVMVTWIPVIVWGHGPGLLELLNIFRIVRLLKLLRWIHELNVILHSIASSALAIFYVYVLIFGLAYHFAVAGVFLFATNDPQHFGDLGASFVTLFQIQSLDDWSEIARTNMYGCDYWGYDTGEEYYDEQCVSPQGLGWFAALYFVIYIMMSVMVLLSLFVGIIITSMELLKEGIKEENEVWEKVKVQQKKYNMRDATINNLLEIFDLIDIGMNGKLSLNELKPIFEIISISEASQFSLYMMVDTDNSGQIDFSEFLELLYLVGKAYKFQNRQKKAKHKKKSIHASGAVMSNSNSLKGIAMAVRQKLSTGASVAPEDKYSGERGDEQEHGTSSLVASSQNGERPVSRKPMPKKLSMVTSAEDAFVDDLNHLKDANYVSDDYDDHDDDDDYSCMSPSSGTGGGQSSKEKDLLSKSFFQKQLEGDHDSSFPSRSAFPSFIDSSAKGESTSGKSVQEGITSGDSQGGEGTEPLPPLNEHEHEHEQDCTTVFQQQDSGGADITHEDESAAQE